MVLNELDNETLNLFYQGLEAEAARFISINDVIIEHNRGDSLKNVAQDYVQKIIEILLEKDPIVLWSDHWHLYNYTKVSLKNHLIREASRLHTEDKRLESVKLELINQTEGGYDAGQSFSSLFVVGYPAQEVVDEILTLLNRSQSETSDETDKDSLDLIKFLLKYNDTAIRVSEDYPHNVWIDVKFVKSKLGLDGDDVDRIKKSIKRLFKREGVEKAATHYVAGEVKSFRDALEIVKRTLNRPRRGRPPKARRAPGSCVEDER